MKYQYVIVAVLSILCIALAYQFIKNTKGPEESMNTQPTPQPTSSADQPPAMTVDKTKTYAAILHTDKGDITVALHVTDTPVTVNNFVYLANKGFYNNTIFHRVIKGFMIQGGDPRGTGSGGPGYRFDDEPFSGEYKRGTMAMANAGPNTNGSQFFIMHADYDLPKNYVIFGNVTDGMSVVDEIATAPVTTSASGEDSKPVTPVTVKSVEIVVR
jgi:cyclophilin family peptidyl-prolyl cis-trans isomerase